MTIVTRLGGVIVEDLPMVCKVDNESVLMAISLYDLRDDIVIVVDTIDVVCEDLISLVSELLRDIFSPESCELFRESSPIYGM